MPIYLEARYGSSFNIADKSTSSSFLNTFYLKIKSAANKIFENFINKASTQNKALELKNPSENGFSLQSYALKASIENSSVLKLNNTFEYGNLESIKNIGKEKAIELIKNDPEIFRYLSLEMRNDPEVAKAAIKKNGFLLNHAGDAICSNREIVLLAVQKAGLSVLRFERDVKKQSEEQDKQFSFNGYVSKELREDPQFMLEAFFSSADYQKLLRKDIKSKEEIRSFIKSACLNLARFINNPHPVLPKFPEFHEHLKDNNNFIKNAHIKLNNELDEILKNAGLEEQEEFKNEMKALINDTIKENIIHLPKPSKPQPAPFVPNAIPYF